MTISNLDTYNNLSHQEMLDLARSRFWTYHVNTALEKLDILCDKYFDLGEASEINKNTDQWSDYLTKLDNLKNMLAETIMNNFKNGLSYDVFHKLSEECHRNFENKANEFLQSAVKFKADAVKVSEQLDSVQSKLQASSLPPPDFAANYRKRNVEKDLNKNLR